MISTRSVAHVLLALALGTPALADKFHFSPPDADAMRARILVGVLIEETDSDYVIRVEGGQVTLPKSLVTKVERDGLTVAQLEGRERDSREALAQANQRRIASQRAAAAVLETSRRETLAAEASASRENVDTATPTYVEVYDPVLHRSVALDSIVESEIRRGLGGLIRRQVERDLRQVRRELRRAYRFR